MNTQSLEFSLCLAILSVFTIGGVQADLLLHYTFDGDDATNNGTLGDGTVRGGSTFIPSTAGPGAGKAWQGNRTGANNAMINTNLPGTSLGFDGSYTAMAWLSWAGSAGGSDHMVFGAPGSGHFTQLHHGIRDDSAPLNIHFGGWGGPADISDAGAVPGDETWTHVAWQYDGSDKVVYVNGAESSRVAGDNVSDPSLEVVIGFTARDGMGSFNGAIDEVRIYGEVLTEGQIVATMQPGEGSTVGGRLAITSIDYNRDDDFITLVFNSRPGQSYTLLWTPDMLNGPEFNEINDSIAAHPSEDETTYRFSAPRPNDNPAEPPLPKAFFLLREN